MNTMKIFTCILRQVPRDLAKQPDHFQLVKECVSGEDEIIWEGSFYECRSTLDTLYRTFVKNSTHFTVYWRDEFSLLVYQHLLEDAGQGALKSVASKR